MNLKTLASLAELTAEFYGAPSPTVKQLGQGVFSVNCPGHYYLTLGTSADEFIAALTRPGHPQVWDKETNRTVEELRFYQYWVEYAVTASPTALRHKPTMSVRCLRN